MREGRIIPLFTLTWGWDTPKTKMNFKNISNQDVHVLVDRQSRKNAAGQPIGRKISTWGIIRPGQVREIVNDAIRGAQKNIALQVTDEKPTLRNVASSASEVALLKKKLEEAEARLKEARGEVEPKEKAPFKK